MRRSAWLTAVLLLGLGAIGAIVWMLGLAPSAPRFTDVTAEAGIRFRHENGARGRRHMAETTSGGGGWLDYDGDGLYDLYLVNGNLNSGTGGEGDTSNRLFRNLGDGTFADVTDEAGVGDRGYGAGLAVGDYDGDGWTDLYVTNFGSNVLYHNEGDGRFRDVTSEAGVAAGMWSTSAAFLDYDSDGHLDLYVCRYVQYDPARVCRTGDHGTYCSPTEFPGVPDVLYRGRGDGTFEDRSVAAGIAVAGPLEGKSLGVIVLDFDDDGDSDIYVACDQTPNLLFRNEGSGAFTEVGLLSDVAYSSEGVSQAGMGIDAGDVNLDGRQDLVVTNFSDERNALYLSEGDGFFREAGTAFGLGGPTLTPLGFGILLLDFDLDGDLDIYTANGHVQDNVDVLRPGMVFRQRDLLLENRSGLRFVDVSAEAGEWFARRTLSRAAACADYDGDGDEDMVIVNSGEPAVLLRNDTSAGHWIALKLRGTRSNRDGYGARIRISARTDDRSFVRVAECRSARSYTSACDPRVRFGLGRAPVVVERVEIRWPSGIRQALERPEADRVHEVEEAEEE